MFSQSMLKTTLRKLLSESVGDLLTTRILEKAKEEFEADYQKKNGKSPGTKHRSAFLEKLIQTGGIIKERDKLLDEIVDKAVNDLGPFYIFKKYLINFIPVFWVYPMSHYAIGMWGIFLGNEEAFSNVGILEVTASSLAVISLLMALFFLLRAPE